MLLAFVLILLALPRVGLVVRPQIVRDGQRVWVECRVARHPDNRVLEWGLAGTTHSARELDGANAQVIHSQWFEVDCQEPPVAYCLLTDQTRQWLAQQSLVCA